MRKLRRSPKPNEANNSLAINCSALSLPGEFHRYPSSRNCSRQPFTKRTQKLSCNQRNAFLLVLWRRLKRVGPAVLFGRVPAVLNPAKGDCGYSDQLFPLRREPLSLGGAHGRMSAIEYVIKTALRRRLSRRVNMMARRNPVKAPSKPSVMERLLNVRRPWPVKRNPVYAIVTVHTIARTRISDLPFRWNSQLALSHASCFRQYSFRSVLRSSEDLYTRLFSRSAAPCARAPRSHDAPLPNEPKNSHEISYMRF